ncbi:MAG: multidrug ABC transporter permease [Alphaproteobacteria bacterium]|nr:multidrug ABC transporter permease [Alphaproteobacteria bacterium]|tara:strand:- start:204 stop:1016 length:813 start_codon:yes stop_codon:yes gene_type:complete
MVEIETKYKFGKRRFGTVNWIGFWTLYKKEVLRFLIVWIQTLLSPLISSLLFLLVLSLALGNSRSDMLGFPFIVFLAPGLIAMQVIQQSFSHSSSSFMIGKIQGNIVDILYAPLSPAEVTLAVSLAATTRSFMIAIVSICTFYFLVDIKVSNYFTLIFFTFVSSFILGSVGIIAGLWAEKFDHMASVTNFLIIPLSFLSGTFYTINNLPQSLQTFSKCNPFFYMIDGFRYSFLEKSDGSIIIGAIYLTILSILLWFISYLLYKRGYKIKS